MTPDHDLLLRATGQVAGALVWLADLPEVHPQLMHLFTSAADDLCRGVESVLTEPDPRIMDESRHLMEIESLLRLFAREPAELESWVQITPHLRNGTYGFGKLMDREGRVRSLPDGHVLAERDEYAVHSSAVHPLPHDEHTAPAGDELTGMLVDLGDLLGHGIRVHYQALDALNAIPPSTAQPPARPTPAMPDLIRATKLIDRFERSIGIDSTRPKSVPRKQDRAKEGTIGAQKRS